MTPAAMIVAETRAHARTTNDRCEASRADGRLTPATSGRLGPQRVNAQRAVPDGNRPLAFLLRDQLLTAKGRVVFRSRPQEHPLRDATTAHDSRNRTPFTVCSVADKLRSAEPACRFSGRLARGLRATSNFTAYRACWQVTPVS